MAVAEQAAGKDNVLHLDIEPGTDIALFNGLFTYVVEQGWIDRDFIANNTKGSTRPCSANKTVAWTSAAVSPAYRLPSCVQAAEWAYKPKAAGHPPRTMHAYEKGIIWGNDNYLIQSALVDLVLATHNVGRRGTGVVRMGGHQEGYTPSTLSGEFQDLHRPGTHQRQRPDDDLVGLQQLPDQQQRASSLREVVLRALADRQGGDAARREVRPPRELVDVIYDGNDRRRLCSSPASTSTRRSLPRRRT